MNKKMFLIAMLSFLTACGGGSSSSNDAANKDDQQNVTGSSVGDHAEEVSYVATETVKRAIASDASPFSPARPSRTITSTSSNAKQTRRLASNVVTIKTTDTNTETIAGDCGGQIATTYTRSSPDNQNEIFPIGFTSVSDFQDYCMDYDGYTMVMSGTLSADMTYTDMDQHSFVYTYSVDYTSDIPDYPSGTISDSESCIKEADQEEACTISSLFEYADGDNYAISDVSIAGSANSGYTVSGTLSADNGDSYDVSVTNLTFCETGNVETGSIEAESNDNELYSVSFPNCDEMIVTYQGVTETLPQN